MALLDLTMVLPSCLGFPLSLKTPNMGNTGQGSVKGECAMNWDRFRKLFLIFWIVGMVLWLIGYSRFILGEGWAHWNLEIISSLLLQQLVPNIGNVGISAAVLAAVFSMRKTGDRRDAPAAQPD